MREYTGLHGRPKSEEELLVEPMGYTTLTRLSIFLQREKGEIVCIHSPYRKAYRRHTQILITSQHIPKKLDYFEVSDVSDKMLTSWLHRSCGLVGFEEHLQRDCLPASVTWEFTD